MELTIPSLEQLEGKNCLEMFKDGHIGAKAVDFAKILGVGTYINNEYYSGYIIKDGSSNKQVTNIYQDNLKLSFNPKNRFMGIRLVVNFSDISKYCSNMRINKDGHIYQANCFMYPRNVMDKNLEMFENLYCEYLNDRYDALLKPINALTLDSYPIDSNCPFFPKTQEQYIYKGKIYVRVLSNLTEPVVLSNNETYKNNQYVWFESSPILWDVDQQNNTAITHDIICGGIPFDKKDKYRGNFEKTDLNDYINRYLKKDLINSIPYTKGGKGYQKTRF